MFGLLEYFLFYFLKIKKKSNLISFNIYLKKDSQLYLDLKDLEERTNLKWLTVDEQVKFVTQ